MVTIVLIAGLITTYAISAYHHIMLYGAQVTDKLYHIMLYGAQVTDKLYHIMLYGAQVTDKLS
jgi:hypothetical protein